jgi:hypothetical protein
VYYMSRSRISTVYLILSIKPTPEAPFRSQADRIRVVDALSLQGRPLVRTLRGGNSVGGGKGFRLAGSGSNGSILRR